jgi:PAT family beta-lactamase induction signal transducer AmpG
MSEKRQVNFTHLITVILLGFASGLPLSLSGTTLQSWYTVENVDLMMIGLLSLVGYPYLIKFLWAPLLDRFSLPWMSHRRAWIITTQIPLIIAIALLGFFSPKNNPWALAYFAIVIAFLSATQDIAIDAYQTDLLTARERGLGVACYSTGYRLAMMVSGGLALIIADHFGWQKTFIVMAGCMLLGVVAALWGPDPEQTVARAPTLKQAIVEPFLDLIKRKKGLWILLFVVLYKFSDAFTNSASGVTMVFFIRELGFSLTEVGVTVKTVGLVAILAGIFSAGTIITRISVTRALFLFGVFQAISNLSFLLLCWYGKQWSYLITAVFLENFSGGMIAAGLTSFLMSLCNKHYTAAQYALLSAIAAIGRVISGPVAAVIVKNTSWSYYFIFACLMAVPGLILLYFLRSEVHE